VEVRVRKYYLQIVAQIQAILISDKIDFMSHTVIRDNEGCHMLIRRSIHQVTENYKYTNPAIRSQNI
jgi:hypothetical protein